MRKDEIDAVAFEVPLKCAWTRCRPAAVALIVVEKEPSRATRAATVLTVFHLRPFWRWTTSSTEPVLAPLTRPVILTLPPTRETRATGDFLAGGLGRRRRWASAVGVGVTGVTG